MLKKIQYLDINFAKLKNTFFGFFLKKIINIYSFFKNYLIQKINNLIKFCDTKEISITRDRIYSIQDDLDLLGKKIFYVLIDNKNCDVLVFDLDSDKKIEKLEKIWKNYDKDAIFTLIYQKKNSSSSWEDSECYEKMILVDFLFDKNLVYASK